MLGFQILLPDAAAKARKHVSIVRKGQMRPITEDGGSTRNGEMFAPHGDDVGGAYLETQHAMGVISGKIGRC